MGFLHQCRGRASELCRLGVLYANSIFLPLLYPAFIRAPPPSPRYLQAQTDDSCAVSSVLGRPTFFITFTCNPKWDEITAALKPGQTWEDRADIVNRVFKLKLNAFLKDLRKGAFFKDKNGRPWKSYYVMYVIEFQKR